MQYGFIGKLDSLPSGLLNGRVIELRRKQYTVITAQGELTAILKGTLYHKAATTGDIPCVGDFVTLAINENGHSQIIELLPRCSKFSRADFSGHDARYAKTVKEQVVASNFHYVFIVVSLGQLFKISRITRYVTSSWQSGGQPVVILTKSDLVSDINTPIFDVEQAAPGVPVHAISSYTRYGIEALHPYLEPAKTVVFLGMSGVGKSSLVNALMEQDIMAVSDIRSDDNRGRHTTTHRQLLMLPSGAMIIDTPGMRELGLFGVDEGISIGFADIEILFSRCHFSDCRHQGEPGCAVQAALVEGSLPRSRWELYLSQQQENRFVDNKTAYMHDKKEKQKSLSKYNKANEKAYKKYGGKKR